MTSTSTAPAAWHAATKELSLVESKLEHIAEGAGVLSTAAKHHFNQKGKRARAILALASGVALGVDRKARAQWATACELLHEASLVHDDLQDRDSARRGAPTVWVVFGDNVAINLGDYLLTLAIRYASEVDADPAVRLELVSLVTEATLEVVRGQTNDNEAQTHTSLTPSAYESIARQKTGPLLALPVLGALCLANRREDLADAREAMNCYGTAYQIQDDLLEFVGLKKRPLAESDLGSGRPSAPVCHYFSLGKERCAPTQEQTRPAYLASWREKIRKSGALELSVAQALSLRDKGHSHAQRLPSPLQDVVGFTADRMLAALYEPELLDQRHADATPARLERARSLAEAS